MKKSVLVFFCSSVSLFAAVHSGLKDAIDNNDMKKASAIIEKLGVKDIYCPATLSVANGQKLYGKRFSENPDLLYSNCDEDFVSAYTQNSCNDKNNIGLCKRILSKTPIDDWFPYLKAVHKNKLDHVAEQYEDEVEIKGKRTKEQCELLMETEDYLILIEDMGADLNSLMKTCMKESGVIGTKKVSKTRYVNPFENYYAQYVTSVLTKAMKLVGFTKENAEEVAFIKTLDFFKGADEELVKVATTSYRDSSYINDKILLSSCRIFPNFDKLVEKQAGFSIFSCKKVLETYSEKNIPMCGLKSENIAYMTQPIMDGAPVYAYSCTRGIWGPFTQKMQEARNAKKMTQPEPVKTIEKVGVSIQTDPADAVVTINGKMLKSKTPCTLKVKPGQYEVMLSKDQYLVKDTVLVVKENRPNMTFKVRLSPVGIGSF